MTAFASGGVDDEAPFSLEVRVASFVENIRVKRFVMEGFSCAFGGGGGGRPDSGGVNIVPLLVVLLVLRCSELDFALAALAAVGFNSGDPTIDVGCDEGGEGSAVAVFDPPACRGGAISAMAQYTASSMFLMVLLYF